MRVLSGTNLIMPPDSMNRSDSPTVNVLVSSKAAMICVSCFFSESLMNKMWHVFVMSAVVGYSWTIKG